MMLLKYNLYEYRIMERSRLMPDNKQKFLVEVLQGTQVMSGG